MKKESSLAIVNIANQKSLKSMIVDNICVFSSIFQLISSLKRLLIDYWFFKFNGFMVSDNSLLIMGALNG